MKRSLFVSATGLPRLLATTLALAMSACATQAPTHKPDSASVSSEKAGTISVTSEDLKLSGRTNLDEALRSVSPVFR